MRSIPSIEMPHNLEEPLTLLIWSLKGNQILYEREQFTVIS